MTTVHAIDELKPRLKEILYRCMEEIRATKAALYFLEPASKNYVLIESYGFRDSQLRNPILPDSDVIDRLLTRRTPFFVNGLGVDPRFSEMLYLADTERILVAPLFSRGRLIAFVDMRDKPSKQPFVEPDLVAAQRISDQIIEMIGSSELFGPWRAIQLSNLESAVASNSRPEVTLQTVPPAQPRPTKPPAVPAGKAPSEGKAPAAATLYSAQWYVEKARATLANDLRRSRSASFVLTDAEFAAIRPSLTPFLLLPNVVMASLSSFSQVGSSRDIATSGPIDAEAMEKFDSKLEAWIRKRGEIFTPPRTQIYQPFEDSRPVDAQSLASILSAPVTAGDRKGLALSVGFSIVPDRATQSKLTSLLESLQKSIEQALSHQTHSSTRQRIAESLLEPDFREFPALKEHSLRVAHLADKFAKFLKLPQHDIDTIRIAAIVHDVGVRFLDYERLYRKQTLTPEERGLLQEHPIIGSAVVARSGLGAEIANIVLCHQERVDGSGYPQKLSAAEIPLASKIIHICEAFDAMTSPNSYQPQLPERQALERIRSLSGQQFDADLVPRFVAMLAG